VAVADASSPASGGAERVELTGILSEFRATLEEEVDTGRRTTVPAASDGARNAR
jgi:hypothetical protein